MSAFQGILTDFLPSDIVKFCIMPYLATNTLKAKICYRNMVQQFPLMVLYFGGLTPSDVVLERLMDDHGCRCMLRKRARNSLRIICLECKSTNTTACNRCRDRVQCLQRIASCDFCEKPVCNHCVQCIASFKICTHCARRTEFG